MYNFKNDYSEGCHPAILQRLAATNMSAQLAYGDDEYSISAKDLLRREMQLPDAAIHLLSGGTQTNLIAIAFLLRVYEAVISATIGHIAVNETGAIEAVGHKVIEVAAADGKLTPELIESIVKSPAQKPPHTVKPKLVYISNATELGTVYNLAELKAIYACCQEHGLLLFIDGARLGQAIVSKDSGLSLASIAQNCDVFYIGGTKNGALLGEALVFTKSDLGIDFAYALKQKGALLAKGRLLGIQFLELFQNNLFYDLATRANALAQRISIAFQEKDFKMLTDSPTNQIFPILPKVIIEQLSQKYAFYVWKEIDINHAAIRIICSWATPEENVAALVADIGGFYHHK